MGLSSGHLLRGWSHAQLHRLMLLLLLLIIRTCRSSGVIGSSHARSGCVSCTALLGCIGPQVSVSIRTIPMPRIQSIFKALCSWTIYICARSHHHIWFCYKLAETQALRRRARTETFSTISLHPIKEAVYIFVRSSPEGSGHSSQQECIVLYLCLCLCRKPASISGPVLSGVWGPRANVSLSSAGAQPEQGSFG